MRQRVLCWAAERYIHARAKYETFILFTVKPWRHARPKRRAR